MFFAICVCIPRKVRNGWKGDTRKTAKRRRPWVCAFSRSELPKIEAGPPGVERASPTGRGTRQRLNAPSRQSFPTPYSAIRGGQPPIRHMQNVRFEWKADIHQTAHAAAFRPPSLSLTCGWLSGVGSFSPMLTTCRAHCAANQPTPPIVIDQAAGLGTALGKNAPHANMKPAPSAVERRAQREDVWSVAGS